MDKVHNAFTMTSMNANMTIFSNQIEIVHGGIHWTFATVDDQHKPVGHMWPSEYSAFDPVFMLHHR